MIEIAILLAKFYITTGLIVGVLTWGTLHLKDFKEFLLESYPDEKEFDFLDNLLVTAYAVCFWPHMLYKIAKQMRQ